MQFKNMTVRAKLTWAFGALAVMVLVVAGVSVKSLHDANARFERYVQGLNTRARLAQEVRAAVDDRAIAARNLVLVSDPAGVEEERRKVTAAHQEVQVHLSRLLEMARSSTDISPTARERIEEIAKIESQYGPVALAIVDLALKGQHEAAIAKMNGECRPLLAALIKASEAYQAAVDARSKELVEASEAAYARQRALLIAACVLAFAAAAVAGGLITRSLMRELGAEPGELSATAQRVATGDLSTVPGADRAPRSSVLASLGAMQTSLAGIVAQVRNASDSIATGSAQIAAGNADLSQRTEQQASNLQQTAASMEQLTSTVQNNAATARQANQLAAGASTAATRGGETVSQVVATMQDIAASSKKIADIIGVIDGIAFQTNILALNAAVEAARAGEQGRGFAVVATEVRSLAQRSANAAKEIKSLIQASVEKTETGARQVDEAGRSVEDIVAQIRNVSQFIEEISRATNEQTGGIEQVSAAVGQLDHVTQQNAALVEESAAAAESLRHQAGRLAEMVQVFKVDEGRALTA